MSDELTTLVHQRIPLAQAMEVTLTHSGGWVATTAPLAPNQNHMGTAFAGSLSAICMLTGWAQLLMLLGLDFPGDIVLKNADLRYLRPVSGDIVAEVTTLSNDATEKFLEEIAASGKADLTLKVQVKANGKVAVAYRGTYTAASV